MRQKVGERRDWTRASWHNLVVDTADLLLQMLVAGPTREDLDRWLTQAQAGDVSETQRGALVRYHALAVQLQGQMVHLASREAELAALNQTAIDLNEIRDVDEILTAIVNRARLLLRADMTYLSLNDEQQEASYMKVTSGALTPEFRRLRLPLGTGLLGLVAQDGQPYFTENYQSDARFVHQGYIDQAVAAEQIHAILGVPLRVRGQVIGTLLAVHRRVRPFSPSEVALLGAFAAHAAVALESARLLSDARMTLDALDAANARLRQQNYEVQQAALAHDRLTGVLTEDGNLDRVRDVLQEALCAPVQIYDDLDYTRTTTAPDGPSIDENAVRIPIQSPRCTQVDARTWVASARADGEHLGSVVLVRDEVLSESERRTVERAAEVVAVILLLKRTEIEAESKIRGELLTDILQRDDHDASRLGGLARRLGVDLDAEFSIAVARSENQDREMKLVRDASLLAREMNGLGAVHRGAIVILAPCAPTELGRAVSGRYAGATVGVASCGNGIHDVRRAWGEAEQTLRALEALGRRGDVSDMTGLGLAGLLLGHNGEREVGQFMERTLAPILEHEGKRGTELVETLQVWFETGGAVGETAARMHVHPNTVGQRLDRVGKLLGPSWRNPDRRVGVQVALAILRLQKHGFRPTEEP